MLSQFERSYMRTELGVRYLRQTNMYGKLCAIQTILQDVDVALNNAANILASIDKMNHIDRAAVRRALLETSVKSTVAQDVLGIVKDKAIGQKIKGQCNG